MAGEGRRVDAEPMREVYVLRCTDCGSQWEDVYEIRRTRDSHGLLQDSFFLDGTRTVSPLTQSGCRFCNDLHVRVLDRRRIHPDPSRPA
jgi:hypothetical protein